MFFSILSFTFRDFQTKVFLRQKQSQKQHFWFALEPHILLRNHVYFADAIHKFVKPNFSTNDWPSSRAVQISHLRLCGGRGESTCFSVPKCFSNPFSKYFKWFHHVLFDSELYISKFSKKRVFKAETNPKITVLICLRTAHFAQKSCFSAKYW